MNSFSFEKELFGGKIRAEVYNPPENVNEIFEDFYDEALRLQKIFNFFDGESELSLLNRKRQMRVSKDLLEVLKKSLKFAELTRGKYDPAIGKRILQRKNRGEEDPLSGLYKEVKIIFNKVTLKNPDIMIDLGSIAKGYITDKLADFLKSKNINEFFINSRGDIAFSGNAEHVIGIKNPRKTNEALIKVKLKNQRIATSGDYEQFYGNFRKSHVINSGDAISVTAISEKLEDADVLATVLFVSDAEERKAILNKFKSFKVLVVKENMEKESYNGFEELVEK